MIEISFHGRGGQGAVTAASLLAVAAFRDGKFSQAFGAFGPERRGAPVAAFCRISDKKIRLREQIENPDIVAVLDLGLIKTVDITTGLKKGGIIIVNSKTDVGLRGNIFRVDATDIALETLGKPIVNTAILGAVVKATKIVSLDSVKEAIKEWFSGKMQELNLAAVQKAYEGCRCQRE